MPDYKTYRQRGYTKENRKVGVWLHRCPTLPTSWPYTSFLRAELDKVQKVNELELPPVASDNRAIREVEYSVRMREYEQFFESKC